MKLYEKEKAHAFKFYFVFLHAMCKDIEVQNILQNISDSTQNILNHNLSV